MITGLSATALHSNYKQLCVVDLPSTQTDRLFNGSIDASCPALGYEFRDYLRPVSKLLRMAGVTHGQVRVSIDEQLVKAGRAHRGTGPHIDGYPTNRSAVIVASNVVGCRVWCGRFYVTLQPNGGISYLDINSGASSLLCANVGYLLNRDCIHESIVQPHAVHRTFLRLALPEEQQ